MESAPDVHHRLAQRVRQLRRARGLSLAALADRAGVSRSMISLIERAESSPTAVVLDRLAAGLGVPLASLFADGPRASASPVARRRAQREWCDPASGYVRRHLSPQGYPSPLELVEVRLPPGARVAYDAGASRDVAQQIWVLGGTLALRVGPARHRLSTGDCLAMRLDRPITFHNPTRHEVRYLVALTADSGQSGSAT